MGVNLLNRTFTNFVRYKKKNTSFECYLGQKKQVNTSWWVGVRYGPRDRDVCAWGARRLTFCS